MENVSHVTNSPLDPNIIVSKETIGPVVTETLLEVSSDVIDSGTLDKLDNNLVNSVQHQTLFNTELNNSPNFPAQPLINSDITQSMSTTTTDKNLPCSGDNAIAALTANPLNEGQIFYLKQVELEKAKSVNPTEKPPIGDFETLNDNVPFRYNSQADRDKAFVENQQSGRKPFPSRGTEHDDGIIGPRVELPDPVLWKQFQNTFPHLPSSVPISFGPIVSSKPFVNNFATSINTLMSFEC